VFIDSFDVENNLEFGAKWNSEFQAEIDEGEARRPVGFDLRAYPASELTNFFVIYLDELYIIHIMTNPGSSENVDHPSHLSLSTHRRETGAYPMASVNGTHSIGAKAH
jgi:hypothetical protein